MPVTLKDIERAADLLRGEISDTPCHHSEKLSELTGVHLLLKYENLQFTGSFKERGALVKLDSLPQRLRRKGVVAMSAGNHAQAVAYRSKKMGIPATIVMPRYTPTVKVEHTRSFGAEVILHGEVLSEAAEYTRRLVTERDLVLVHPYDDEKIIAGQGTIALEMLTCRPDLDVLIVPIGGGGLISGIAVAATALNPEIEIVGVQTSRFPSMRQALLGEPIACGRSSIAEGIAVKTPGKKTLPIIRKRVHDILLVDEPDIESAVQILLDMEKTVVEGAGAVGLAALIKHRKRFSGRKVGLVLSGGNIDPLVLSAIIERGLVHSGRMIRLLVDVRDVPGALAEVSRCIGEIGANIVEVHHQRAFTRLPLQSAEVEFILTTRGNDHVGQLLSFLTENGLKARLMDIPE